jgi:hypothetical protein
MRAIIVLSFLCSSGVFLPPLGNVVKLSSARSSLFIENDQLENLGSAGASYFQATPTESV